MYANQLPKLSLLVLNTYDQLTDINISEYKANIKPVVMIIVLISICINKVIPHHLHK